MSTILTYNNIKFELQEMQELSEGYAVAKISSIWKNKNAKATQSKARLCQSRAEEKQARKMNKI